MREFKIKGYIIEEGLFPDSLDILCCTKYLGLISPRMNVFKEVNMRRTCKYCQKKLPMEIINFLKLKALLDQL